jgi:DNA polymerase III subunit alpha
MLEEVLKETYGIFVYQEQVMQAAQVLAGYSLGEPTFSAAPWARRSRARWTPSERASSRAARATQSRRQGQRAVRLDRQVRRLRLQQEPRRGYALIAYQTAWLKRTTGRILRRLDELRHGADRQARLFVEDMRRGGVECLPPCINASEAFFTVEGEGVRYALGALKGVGEKAMEALVAERIRGGAFKSLNDFAERIEPRSLNRRQIESLAGGGAFDSIEPNRAAVFEAAETVLAHAASAADQRESGQVKSFAELPSIALSSEDGRATAIMAALVEETRWRTSARGRRYLVATLSDPSGQFQATAFDDEPIAAMQKAAESGDCGLLTVEVDRRPGDEMPRVAIKRVQPLDALARRTRLQMIVRCADSALIPAVAREIAQCRGGTDVVRLILPLAGGGEAQLLAGREFALDAEVAARVERIAGENSVELTVREPPRLALVG